MKHLSRCYAFYYLYYFRNSHSRHTLDQKMNVVLICPYFNKLYLISFADAKTNFFYVFTYFSAYDFSPIFHRKNQMIKQQRLIVPFVNMFIHKNENTLFQSAMKTFRFSNFPLYNPRQASRNSFD